MYNVLIEELSKSREQFIEWTFNAGFPEKIKSLVNSINNGNQSMLTGKFISACNA